MINFRYQIFIIFALCCISITLSIIYSIEKDDAHIHQTSTKSSQAYLISMIVMWVLSAIVASIVLYYLYRRRQRGTAL